jgi:hypothetical protein
MNPDNINKEFGTGSCFRADNPANPYGEGLSIYRQDQ